LIKSNKVLLVIIFIDSALLVGISKKLNLTIIIFVNKLNLYLVYTREYLFRFMLLIWYKLSKANFVLNVLSYLFIVNNPKLEAINNIVRIPLTKEGELNMLFAYNTFTNKLAHSKVYNKFNKYYIFDITFIKIALDYKEKFI